MAIKTGKKVRATCKNREIYEGILYEICLGINKEEPTQASIFISEEESENMKFGQVHIWCNELKDIEILE